jgi:hypothetical protein
MAVEYITKPSAVKGYFPLFRICARNIVFGENRQAEKVKCQEERAAPVTGSDLAGVCCRLSESFQSSLTGRMSGAVSAETIGVNFARRYGIEGVDAAALAKLRALSVAEIVDGGQETGGPGGVPTKNSIWVVNH